MTRRARVDAELVRRGLARSRQQAAELIGLHENALGRMERGVAFLTFPTLVALAKAYRIPLRELFK